MGEIHGKTYVKGMDVNYRNVQNWMKRVGRNKDIRGWEAFIHLLVQQMFIEHLLAPGTDQALGLQTLPKQSLHYIHLN